MVRSYCKIVGTREQDYTGKAFGQEINQEMTVFSGGAGVQYTEEVIRASRDVFQLYGGKTAYTSGVFTSVMRSIAGQAFVCYGISQKQALGRDAQFTQSFVVPREDLLDGSVYLREVFGRNFVPESMVHRATRPTNEEIFTATEYVRREVNELSEQRLKVLMHAVVLLCNGRKVLLVERDKEYQKDFFRPLLRELFELIPDGHRYQIDVTTGRCLDDIERLASAQLIVTNQPFGGTPERPQLCLDGEDGEVRVPNTRVWPSVTLTQDGRNEFRVSTNKPNATAHTMEWAMQTNAQRDELSAHDEIFTKTLQTDFAKLMECMDEEKSFWWRLPRWEHSIPSLPKLVEMHEATYILSKPSYNVQFCERLPALLSLQGGVRELYFDFMETKMTEELRRKYLAYVQNRLQNFALTEDEFTCLKGEYKNFEATQKEIHLLKTALAEQTNQYKGRVNAVSALLQRIKSGVSRVLGVPSASAQEPRETEGPLR